jgi:hypothetical protein
MLRQSSNGNVVTALNYGEGGFSWQHGTQLTGFGGSAQWQPLIGDFGGSVDEELMVRNRDTGDVAIAYNDGTGKLTWNGSWVTDLSGLGASQDWLPLVGRFEGGS